MKPLIYVIGSLRNPQIPDLVCFLREQTGYEVFADWYAAGPEADDYWKAYEEGQGYTYLQALKRPAARNVFNFDHGWLARASHAVLALPAGKSGHLELGWHLGKGKPGFILLDSPDRWDVMYQFATGITEDRHELSKMLLGT